jgi:hypothetical protein
LLIVFRRCALLAWCVTDADGHPYWQHVWLRVLLNPLQKYIFAVRAREREGEAAQSKATEDDKVGDSVCARLLTWFGILDCGTSSAKRISERGRTTIIVAVRGTCLS